MDESRLINRRDVVQGIALGGPAATASAAQNYSRATRGLPPLKITNVKTIATCPNNIRTLVVVKVETSEAGRHAPVPVARREVPVCGGLLRARFGPVSRRVG